MNKTVFVVAVLLIAVTGWFLLALNSTPNNASDSIVINKSHTLKRQDFILPDLQGRPQAFSQWNDKVVVLNFWATWCPPCRREIPDFIDVYHQYQNQDLVIIGVGTDNPKTIAAFVKQFNIPYPILTGERKAMQISYQYGNHTGALPYTIVFDKKGIIRYRAGGLMSRQKLLALVKPLL